MKTQAPFITHFSIGLIVIAGIIALWLGLTSPDTLTPSHRMCYVAYGVLFLIGGITYYIRPLIGSAILVVSLLSMIAVAPLADLPVWADGTTATKLTIIVAAVLTAVEVSEPLWSQNQRKQP